MFEFVNLFRRITLCKTLVFIMLFILTKLFLLIYEKKEKIFFLFLSINFRRQWKSSLSYIRSQSQTCDDRDWTSVTFLLQPYLNSLTGIQLKPTDFPVLISLIVNTQAYYVIAIINVLNFSRNVTFGTQFLWITRLKKFQMQTKIRFMAFTDFCHYHQISSRTCPRTSTRIFYAKYLKSFLISSNSALSSTSKSFEKRNRSLRDTNTFRLFSPICSNFPYIQIFNFTGKGFYYYIQCFVYEW